jgi:phage tail-like protein
VTKGQHGVQSIEENIIMKWKLTGVLPTRFKGPDLSSTADQVAIEELHLVHEGLELERPVP